MNRHVALAVVIASVSGCAAGESSADDGDVAVTTKALIGATPTSELNAIGYLSIESELDCTATLIGTRAIITAGHCLNGVPNPHEPIAHALFLFADGRRTAEVLRVEIIGVDGEDDLAIAELGRDVKPGAPDFTEPLPLAWEPPKSPTLRIFGYGCEDVQIVTLPNGADSILCADNTSNAKRSLALPTSILGDLNLTNDEAGQLVTLTPADSGGPVIGGDLNAVWGIASETLVARRADGSLRSETMFGGVGWHRNDIESALFNLDMFIN